MESIKKSEQELRYCIALLRSSGNWNVPLVAIASYLDTQAAGARMQSRTADAVAYAAAAEAHRFGTRADAIGVLALRLTRLTHAER